MGVTPLAPQASASASSATFARGPAVPCRPARARGLPQPGPALQGLVQVEGTARSVFFPTLARSGTEGANKGERRGLLGTDGAPAAGRSAFGLGRAVAKELHEHLDDLAHLEGLTDPGGHGAGEIVRD